MNTGRAAFQRPKSKSDTLIRAPKVGITAGPPALPPPPGKWSGKKMVDDILRDNPPEREMFVGGAPLPDREAEKDRLSRVMEYGPKGAREMEERTAAMKQAAMQRIARNKRVDVKEEMIDLIIDEIRERREFLEGMRAAGRVEQYEQQVRSEIKVRMRELEKLGLATKPGP